MSNDRLSLPPLPAPPPPWRFPWVAFLAPIVVSLAIWMVTGSTFALIFAALGPVTALANFVEQVWSGRRARRQERTRFELGVASLKHEIALAHSHEGAERDELLPDGPAVVGLGKLDRGRWRAHDGALDLVVGRGRVASRVSLSPVPAHSPGDEVDALRSLVESARFFFGAVAVDARLGVGVCGPDVAVVASVRGLIIQAARSLPPDRFWVSADVRAAEAEWLEALPHPRRIASRGPAVPVSQAAFGRLGESEPVITIAWALSEQELPDACRVVVSFDAGVVTLTQHPDRGLRGPLTPSFVPRTTALAWAAQTSDEARAAGRIVVAESLPARVELAALFAATEQEARLESMEKPLACTFAVGGAGPLVVDLVSDGPHAVVGGTTGSGKSELLISWVLAIAASHSPERVNFLLVDFKGGSAFGPLSSLPHAVGTITDLDSSQAERALLSLRAEIHYRERILAEAGARSVDGTALPRLVIVVDEFAAMLADHAELHALFADIAARGRSLGIHLILGTQRPASSVRDGVLANADLRISLRVNNRADSAAVVGVDSAAELPVELRGRAVIRIGDQPVVAQVALASEADPERIVTYWAGSPEPRRPWCDPLPSVVRPVDLVPVERGRALGLLDLPHEQGRATGAYDEHAHGHLLVLGGPRSGKSSALATLNGELVPSDPATAWDALAELVGSLSSATRSNRFVMIDDIDSLVPRFEAEHRAIWLDGLARLLRDGPAHGVHCALTAQRLVGELHSIAGLIPARLMLRHASRQDWVLAGGDSSHAMVAGPPGAGRWQGHQIQVAYRHDLRRPAAKTRWDLLAPDRPLIIATTRAASLVRRFADAGLSPVGPESVPLQPGVGALPAGAIVAGAIVVGDVEDWQSRWGLLSSLRPHCEVVFDGCSLADFRALTRSRTVPPPLPPDDRAAWIFRQDSTAGRVRLPA